MTLVEVMMALLVFGMFTAGFMASFMQSRKLTENSIMHAAATSLVYGIIEQLKMAPYTSFPDASNQIEVRINQNTKYLLNALYTPSPGAPAAPTSTPATTVSAASVGMTGSLNNQLPTLPLSSVSGTSSQALTVTIWMWIDEIPDATRDVVEVKKVTVVYTYSYNNGGTTKTVRDREVFLRTRYDQ
jgi:hypothetical protein